MQYPRGFGSKKLGSRADSPEMPKGTDDLSASEVRRRVQTVRQFVAGDNQTLFAKQIGVAPNRWNNIERGSPLSKDVAFRLVKAVPGLTLDWLYLGNENGLPTLLQRELTAVGRTVIEAEEAAAIPSPSAKNRSTRSRA